jgi:hypothetical protein
MERLAIAAMNGHSRVAFVGASQTSVDMILNSDQFRYSLIRDVHRRQAQKLRAMS